MTRLLMAAAGNALGGGVDEYFKYVTMLLHGDGTNGAQNNTFLDSSTNNFTITRNGNTTQGSFSPYGSNWSNYFDGSSSYLNFGNQTALHLGSGDFTVETWIFKNANNSYMTLCGDFASASTNTFQILADSGGTKIGWYNGATNSFTITSVATIPLATWTHIAFVRSGTTLSLYINGSLDSSASLTTNYNASTSLYVAHTPELAAGRYWNGYISNLRIVKGTAVYTSAFTPSTTPLTAISGTSLLSCQSNRFIDNSTNNFAITRNGDVSVQRFSPFSPTASYATATIGGSVVLDAVNDTLVTPINNAFNLGTGAFQIDFWMYPTGSPAQFAGPFGTNNNGGTGGIFFANRNGNLDFVSNNDNITLIRTTYPALNSWYHVVLVRNSSGLRAFFLNGVRIGTASDAADFNQTQFTIGAYNASNGGWPGYISNFRVIKGSNIVDPNSSTITVPTAPTTAVTNTSLLLNFTNGGIFDNAMMNNLETVGDAQISTSVRRFGTGSLAFDGTGDYMVLPASPQWLMSGDWTIECWIYPTRVTGVQTLVETRNRTTNASPVLYLNGSNLVIDTGTAPVVSSGTISANTWQHVAATRSGNSWRIFINGTQVGATTTNTTAYTTAYGCCVGSSFYNEDYAGYIDDLRVTKGYARYTANFTPPAAAFADK